MTELPTPKEQKRALRPLCRRVRKNVTDKAQKAAAICSAVCALPAFQNAKVLLCYYGVGDEVATTEILKTALQCGKRVGVPRCFEDSRMEFLEIRSLSDLSQISAFGIPEAPESAAVIAPATADLCLVPALAFAKDGFRIGYGMGYYDRYLKRFSGCSVGLCFDDCLCERLPTNQNDRPVHMIVTERKILAF